MVWMQPQLTDPPMVSAEIGKLNRRLLLAYAKNSKAVEVGVKLHDVFDTATDQALRNIQEFLGIANDQRGVLTYETKVRLGVVVTPPKAPAKRFVQQGVGFSTDAFLMGDPAHSYVDATTEGTAETLRLALPLVGVPKVLAGYSMGADILNRVLLAWPANRRDEIKLAVTFGSPARPAGTTLLGNDPGGSGISGLFTPDWARPITYDFTHAGDMYANAVGLLPQLYQILIRLEASTDFALYLFQVLMSSMGGALLGTTASSLTGAGALSGILGLVTAGPTSQTTGPPNLMAMIFNIPAIIQTLVAALQFISTNAHYHYHDQPNRSGAALTRS
jgi:membrane associated rhomboid family serine protease